MMKMKNFSGREKIISGVCIAVVTAALIVNFFSGPLKGQTKELESKIRMAEHELNKAMRTIAWAESIDDNYEHYRKLFFQTGTDEATFSRIIAGIERIAGENEIHITDLKPRLVRTDGDFNVYSVSISMNEPLEKTASFLDRLQQEPELFRLDSLELSRQTGRGSQDLQSNVTVSRLFVRESKP